jgi:hypothetical protein
MVQYFPQDSPQVDQPVSRARTSRSRRAVAPTEVLSLADGTWRGG